MDTINAFLDTMFSPYPVTPRLVAAKEELRAMMEDAYTDALASGRSHNEAVGSVITDFGNLEELAPVLGILPDIRHATPNDSGVDAPIDRSMNGPVDDADAEYPTVTLPEAQELAEARRQTGSLLGWAIALFVVAGGLLAGISMLASEGLLPMSEDVGVAVGLVAALILVASGVALLMRRNHSFAGVTHLARGKFTQDPIVTAWSARLRAEHEGTHSKALAIAVFLWIIAAIPVVALSIAGEDNAKDYSGYGVMATCLLVAVGFVVLMPTTWASSTNNTLQHTGRPHSKPTSWTDPEKMPFTDAIAGPYWLGCLLFYLTWSFLADGWGITWIIWPIAGVLFGLIAAAEAGRRSWLASRK